MSQVFKNGLSLKTQIYGLIILISMISFTVRILADVSTTRQYLQTQLGSHAQDTATSLGLSISPYLETDNVVIAETMATAIFDSGYYKNIKLTDAQGDIIFNLEYPDRTESVPNWFVELSVLNAPTKVSELNSGWLMAGKLAVTSHTGQSYLTLWQHTLQSLYSASILLVTSLLMAFLILQAVFKPLKMVENQAKLVTRKRFTLNKKIPITRELRTVTKAINNMVINLQTTFDSLTKQTELLTEQVYIDPLTGLGNRKSCENHFNSIVDNISEDSVFTAIMITLPSLANINQSMSYQDGDKHVQSVANNIKTTFQELSNCKIFRLNGSTFVILAPYDKQFLNKYCLTLTDIFNLSKNTIHINGFASLGVTNIEKGSSLSDVLSVLDTDCIFSNQQSTPLKVEKSTLFSVKQWRELINSIIESGEISFSAQPVKQSFSTNRQCYLEVFSHFIHNGKKVNNSHLFAMAEKLNLTEELDKKLIRDFVNIKEQYPNDVFAINLSKSSLYSTDFIKWLIIFSQTKPVLKNNLLFEIHESSLLYDVNLASSHIDVIKELGIGVCIEHFGTSLTSFRYLQGLDIEYVKIDGSYIQDVVDNSQSQFFIQTVNTICHGFGIKVIACLIERSDTLHTLENLGCDGLQGNLIVSPSKINDTLDNNMNKKFTFCSDTLKFCD
ncbi:EAL domain-containing protein [Pseudoalteromonas mariniglutinosa]|uniref:bifunctional diguanylate cyclase/phosphodiesterase n=1 Tax=Pseudoalteromonas mariniglutinosa TaxID=206042 RepID=UPI00384B553F